jgi:hypothetical protein
MHIYQHYELYQEKYKEANIPEHHWAIPCHIQNKRKVSQKHGKVQGTLDSAVIKLMGPQVFSCENLLYVVTQFITVDDQVRLTVQFLLNICYQSTSP